MDALHQSKSQRPFAHLFLLATYGPTPCCSSLAFRNSVCASTARKSAVASDRKRVLSLYISGDDNLKAVFQDRTGDAWKGEITSQETRGHCRIDVIVAIIRAASEKVLKEKLRELRTDFRCNDATKVLGKGTSAALTPRSRIRAPFRQVQHLSDAPASNCTRT